MPISGAVGFLGEAALAGARAYFQMVNADGGAKGRQYQLIVVDTQFEPSVEALGTKRLVEQDKVLALMSVLGDSSASYVASKGIPEAALGASPTAFSSRYPNIYPVCCNVVETAIQWPYQLTQVQKLPIKTVGILYGTENIPVGQWLQYFTKAWEIWGVQVKSTDAFNLSDGDCTSIVLKMRSLNIDYWDIANSLGWPLCGQSMTRQNYKPPLGFGGTYTPDAYFIAQAGSGVDGVYGGTMGPQIAQNFGEPYEWDPSGKAPQTQRFVDSVKKYSPRNGDIRSLESGWTISYWVGAQLIDQAIKAQPGAITWKGMNDWIQGQRDWRSGLLAPMSFDPKCKIPAQWRTYQWKWNGSAYEQTDWHQYADKAKLQPNGQPWGHWHMPAEAKNKIIPGAGDCLATALADVVVRG